MIKVGQLYAANQNDAEYKYFVYLLVTKVNKRCIHYYIWNSEDWDENEYLFLYQKNQILDSFNLIDEV